MIMKNVLINATGIIKQGCSIVVPILVSMIFTEKMKQLLNEIHYNGNVDYDDVIKAILDSEMFSSSKQEAVSLLKFDGNEKYYNSVISIVNSSMYSSDKIKMIQNLNNKWE